MNRSPLPRARELLGLVRTVLFSPEDLALVKGDPSERRHFLDDLLVQRAPRFAGVRSDYDRVLKQRNSLLKTAGIARRQGRSADSALSTLGVWDSHLARTGAELLVGPPGPGRRAPAARRDGVRRGGPGRDPDRRDDDLQAVLRAADRPGRRRQPRPGASWPRPLLAEVERRRGDEIDRGISLVGPHRDDLTLMLGPLPVKGYASHGESWSIALALRLASYDLLRAAGDDPILILDDVFAELDTERRERLAELVAGAEQVLVTAAVPDDVPAALAGARVDVVDGKVLPGVA